MKNRIRKSRGFSLVELAIALMIVTLLSAGAITALQVQNERGRLLETRAQLFEAREALLNYATVQSSPTLPCPDLNGDGDPDACDNKSVHRGGLPWRLLGLPARDAWGQNLHYAVHTKFVTGKTIQLSSTSGLEIQSQGSNGQYTSLANQESVVLALWSSGADSTPNPIGETDSKVLAEAPNSDDVVIWLSRFVLLGRMLEAGRDIPQ